MHIFNSNLMDTPEKALIGREVDIVDRESPDRSPRRLGCHGKSGQMQLPSNSRILEQLYNDNGIRVRMLRRGRPHKVPTVKELIDHLAKRQQCDRSVDLEAKGRSVEKPNGYTGIGSNRDSMMNTSSLHSMADNMRCVSEAPRHTAMEGALQDQLRSYSERPAKFEVMDIDYTSMMGLRAERLNYFW